MGNRDSLSVNRGSSLVHENFDKEDDDVIVTINHHEPDIHDDDVTMSNGNGVSRLQISDITENDEEPGRPGTPSKSMDHRKKCDDCTKLGKIFWLILLIFVQAGDVWSDIKVARYHHQKENYVYLILTALLVVGPAGVMTYVCFCKWYWNRPEDRPRCDRVRLIDIVRYISLPFLMAPFVQRLETIFHTGKRIYLTKKFGSEAAQVQTSKLKKTEMVSTTLALYEAFMESGPQAILLVHLMFGEERGFRHFFTNSDKNYTKIMMADKANNQSASSSSTMDGPVELPFVDSDYALVISLIFSILNLVVAIIFFRRVMVSDKEPSSDEAEIPACHPIYYSCWLHLILIGIRIFAVAKASMTSTGAQICMSILLVHCLVTWNWLARTKTERLQLEYQNCPIYLLTAVHLFTFFFTSRRDVTTFTFCNFSVPFLLDVVILIVILTVENVIFLTIGFLA